MHVLVLSLRSCLAQSGPPPSDAPAEASPSNADAANGAGAADGVNASEPGSSAKAQPKRRQDADAAKLVNTATMFFGTLCLQHGCFAAVLLAICNVNAGADAVSGGASAAAQGGGGSARLSAPLLPQGVSSHHETAGLIDMLAWHVVGCEQALPSAASSQAEAAQNGSTGSHVQHVDDNAAGTVQGVLQTLVFLLRQSAAGAGCVDDADCLHSDEHAAEAAEEAQDLDAAEAQPHARAASSRCLGDLLEVRTRTQT